MSNKVHGIMTKASLFDSSWFLLDKSVACLLTYFFFWHPGGTSIMTIYSGIFPETTVKMTTLSFPVTLFPIKESHLPFLPLQCSTHRLWIF